LPLLDYLAGRAAELAPDPIAADREREALAERLIDGAGMGHDAEAQRLADRAAKRPPKPKRARKKNGEG